MLSSFDQFKKIFSPLTTSKAIHWILCIGFLVYFITLLNGFVWDDFPFLLNNADIRSINIPLLFDKNVFNDASFYRPIPALYNALLYSVSGDIPFLYHFIQMVLHCINACLVFLLFKKFLTKSVSFFLSLIFLVHPINVEAVAYISAANNQLFFLFGMSALLISMKAKIKKAHLLFISVLSLLSLLSRETGIAFIFLIIIYQIIYVRKKTIMLLGIEAISIGIYFFLRFFHAGIYYTKEITKYPIPIAQLPLLQRMENIPLILLYYVSHIFYPAHFAVSQHWIVTNITFESFYFPLIINCIIVLLGIVFGLYLYKKKRGLIKQYLFFCLWFLSGVIFIIQIVPLELTVADHWMYFPFIGILGLLGVLLEVILFNSKYTLPRTLHKIIFIIAILLIVLLSVRTVIRISNYKDEITLYTHDSTIYSDWKLENDLGSDYARMGDMHNAYIHFKRSYEYHPTPWNLYHLGLHYQNVGDLKKASIYYSEAYKSTKSSEFKSLIESGESSIEYNIFLHLAKVNLLDKNYKGAIDYSKKGLNVYPHASDLLVTLAVSHHFNGNQTEALAAATEAYNLFPNNKDTKYVYERLLKNQPIDIKK